MEQHESAENVGETPLEEVGAVPAQVYLPPFDIAAWLDDLPIYEEMALRRESPRIHDELVTEQQASMYGARQGKHFQSDATAPAAFQETPYGAHASDEHVATHRLVEGIRPGLKSGRHRLEDKRPPDVSLQYWNTLSAEQQRMVIATSALGPVIVRAASAEGVEPAEVPADRPAEADESGAEESDAHEGEPAGVVLAAAAGEAALAGDKAADADEIIPGMAEGAPTAKPNRLALAGLVAYFRGPEHRHRRLAVLAGVFGAVALGVGIYWALHGHQLLHPPSIRPKGPATPLSPGVTVVPKPPVYDKIYLEPGTGGSFWSIETLRHPFASTQEIYRRTKTDLRLNHLTAQQARSISGWFKMTPR